MSKVFGFCDTGCKREVVSEEKYFNTIGSYDLKKHDVNLVLDTSTYDAGGHNINVTFETDSLTNIVCKINNNYVTFRGYIGDTGGLLTGDIDTYNSKLGIHRMTVNISDDGVRVLPLFESFSDNVTYMLTTKQDVSFNLNTIYQVVPKTDEMANKLSGDY